MLLLITIAQQAPSRKFKWRGAFIAPFQLGKNRSGFKSLPRHWKGLSNLFLTPLPTIVRSKNKDLR